MSTTDIFDLIRSSELVIFVGHGGVSDDCAFIDFGDFRVSGEQLSTLDWTAKLAMLIGCETAALDIRHGDLAELLLRRGARAVVGTTAQVELGAAQIFFEAFLKGSISGMPLDYAFFPHDAKR
jgi:hypothetical protein